MINKKSIGIFAILASILAVSMVLPARALVTFDPATGTGFVGKGDVQLAFGWNNKALQDNALGVTFTYVAINEYLVTEVWATGNPANPWTLQSHTATVALSNSMSSALDGSPRQEKGQKQFTGFILSGISGTTVIGDLPPSEDTINWNAIVYDRKIGQTWYYNLETELLPFDANGNLYTEGNYKAVLSVELISSTGGLYTNYGATSVLIY
ncbi:MAG: hypothetical protein NWE98_10160 [Candidatus Bathyarchaeota archaeon]|nr:hypothetical protein [Candidatus Bathyarchaeota archaeon]